ncbi:M48 family metallopeptidase [Leeia sp. TBRC 13508]|uniref:M48 family metallopeptidase n=1 Tax=Leeia speluncae TaxID=2884804 RepID=A0ABS8D569_9NEIS|nr:SprT family zinc-dependent metalloprotease [Leeia speluncae]MCB6183370.1 M48 family metallopeptidase [Leeia speluncae]
MDRRRSRPHPSVTLTTTAGSLVLQIVDADTVSQYPVLVRHGQRRTIGLAIKEAALVIHLPARANAEQALPFIQQKAAWLAKHLGNVDNRPKPPDFADGSSIDWLGEQLTIVLLPGRTRGVEVEQDGQYLVIRVPTGKPATVIPPAVAEWMAGQALAYFLPRFDSYAQLMRLTKTPPLSLSSARQKWGSCDHKGEIKLNWRLMQAPPALIDYVICHELAHLKEFNHGPAFWQIVATLCPDYKARRKALKEQGTAWLSW